MSFVPRSPNVELLASTTYKLIRPLEAVALLLQATNLFASPLNDRYRAHGVPIVLALGIVHLAFAALLLRSRGPLTRGPTWSAAWIALIFVMQMLFAHLLAPGDFAAYGVGVPMGNYALIPLAVFAFYPWDARRRVLKRRLIEGLLIAAVVLHPLLIVGLMNHWQFTNAHVRSLAQYGGWALVWFLVGKGIAWLCRIAVQVETEALSKSYRTALGDFHTHVDNAVNRIEAGGDVREVAYNLRQLVYRRQRQLLMTQTNVPAVGIFKIAMRAPGDRLTVRKWPQVGPLTIPNEQALLFEQGLADLLKNAVDHGGGTVEVAFVLEDGIMTVDVRDFGPGLPRDRFEAPGSGLQTLRTQLVERGGNLELREPPIGGGATVRLTLPVRQRR